MYVTDSAMVTLVDSSIRGNRAQSNYGGGIYAVNLDATYPVRFIRVQVADNQSNLEGGGIHVHTVANTTIEESLFEGNEA